MANTGFARVFTILATCFCVNCGSAGNSASLDNIAGGSNSAVALDTDLLAIDDISLLGAFVVSRDTFGQSSANWSNGVIHVEDDRFYIASHNHDDNIAEFVLPPLTEVSSLNELEVANQTRQNFVSIYNSSRLGNPENHDYISGIYQHNGALVVNSLEYYDAPADNQQTTIVVRDSANLQSSEIIGLHSLKGAARAAGWISEIPDNWQGLLGGKHISGNSSGLPIIGRMSVGPSAFVFDIESLVSKSSSDQINTKEVLGFSLSSPLHRDLDNRKGENSIWTHISEVKYGFIVPDTSTYMTIGVSGGHESGVGYKVVQDDGFLCPGFCPHSSTDFQNYYWLWDVNDMVRVRNGELSPSAVRPYSYGSLTLPSWITAAESSKSFAHKARIGGASYDPDKDILYVSILNVLNAQNINPPIVLGYQIDR